MNISRKSFLQGAVVGAASISGLLPLAVTAGNKKKPIGEGELNLSFNEGVAPGETLEQKLDFMEANGVVGLEPGGGGLAERVKGYKSALNGRNVKISAICAGFDGFILSADADVRKKFDTTYKSILTAAGELGSTGVVMVPAFNSQKPIMEHDGDTRKYLIEELYKLGEYALSAGTTVILEPLNRGEAHYLRQVADAASMCRDAKCAGVKCMGDFWHMTFEEVCDYSALYGARDYLQHVHIASRKKRNMPSEDGLADNYMDGFRALKEIGYKNYVSFECGCGLENREEAIKSALTLIRDQWKKA